jgi:hypothetical protein
MDHNHLLVLIRVVDGGRGASPLRFPDHFRVTQVGHAAGARELQQRQGVAAAYHLLQDEVDIRLVLERMADTRPRLSATEVHARIAAKGSSSKFPTTT